MSATSVATLDVGRASHADWDSGQVGYIYIIWLPEWEPVPSDPDDAIDYMSQWDYGEYSDDPETVETVYNHAGSTHRKRADSTYYASWYMDAPSRRAFVEAFGRNADLYAKDIVRIAYAKRVLYERGGEHDSKRVA